MPIDQRQLRRLCTAIGVSGDEGEVRKIVMDELKGSSLEMQVDALGNVLVHRPGRGAKRIRVMLDAHMDEAGFMIVAEDGDGLYEFKIIGGIDPRSIAAKQVVVGKKRIPGVIGAKPIHLTTAEDRKKPFPIETLRVDLGPGGKANLGDRGTFAPNFRRSGPAIMSKALDNRLGVAILIEIMKHPPADTELMAAFTVQEEIGFRGAKVAAQYFKPEAAIVIDATPAYDLPMQMEGENTFYNTQLGGGPALYVRDPSAIDDPRLVKLMMDTAAKARIPIQIRQPGGGGNNASAIQRAGIGVPVVAVSVPHRYPHSAMSVARIEDCENTLALVSTALRHLDRQVLKRGE